MPVFYMVVTGAAKGTKRAFYSSKKAALKAAKDRAKAEKKDAYVLAAATSIDLKKAIAKEEKPK